MPNYYDPSGYTRYNQRATQRQRAAMTQGLTQEEINQLKNKNVNFTLKPDPIELIKSRCTHRENGHSTLQKLGDNLVECKICGKRFRLIESEEQAHKIIENFENLMQTIKAYYLDMPVDYLKELYRTVPVMEKMPILFKIAFNNFNQYHSIDDLHDTGRSHGFETLRSIGTGQVPSYGGNGLYDDPYAQQPPYYQQPQYGAPYPPDPRYAPRDPYADPRGYAPRDPYADPRGYAPNQSYSDPRAEQPQYGGAPNPLTTDGFTAPGPGYDPAPNANKDNSKNGDSDHHVTKQFDI